MMKKIMGFAMVVMLTLCGCQNEKQKANTIRTSSLTERETLIQAMNSETGSVYDVRMDQEIKSIVAKSYEWKDGAWEEINQLNMAAEAKEGYFAFSTDKDGMNLTIGFSQDEKNYIMARGSIDDKIEPAAAAKTAISLSNEKDIKLDKEFCVYGLMYSEGGHAGMGEDVYEHPESYINENTKKLICVTVTFQSKAL